MCNNLSNKCNERYLKRKNRKFHSIYYSQFHSSASRINRQNKWKCAHALNSFIVVIHIVSSFFLCMMYVYCVNHFSGVCENIVSHVNMRRSNDRAQIFGTCLRRLRHTYTIAHTAHQHMCRKIRGDFRIAYYEVLSHQRVSSLFFHFVFCCAFCCNSIFFPIVIIHFIPKKFLGIPNTTQANHDVWFPSRADFCFTISIGRAHLFRYKLISSHFNRIL